MSESRFEWCFSCEKFRPKISFVEDKCTHCAGTFEPYSPYDDIMLFLGDLEEFRQYSGAAQQQRKNLKREAQQRARALKREAEREEQRKRNARRERESRQQRARETDNTQPPQPPGSTSPPVAPAQKTITKPVGGLDRTSAGAAEKPTTPNEAIGTKPAGKQSQAQRGERAKQEQNAQQARAYRPRLSEQARIWHQEALDSLPLFDPRLMSAAEAKAWIVLNATQPDNLDVFLDQEIQGKHRPTVLQKLRHTMAHNSRAAQQDVAAENQSTVSAYEILVRDEFRCIYTRQSSLEDLAELQLDHVKPRRLGGLTIASNMAVALAEYNRDKSGERLPLELEARVLAEIARRNITDGIDPDAFVNVADRKAPTEDIVSGTVAASYKALNVS